MEHPLPAPKGEFQLSSTLLYSYSSPYSYLTLHSHPLYPSRNQKTVTMRCIVVKRNRKKQQWYPPPNPTQPYPSRPFILSLFA